MEHNNQMHMFVPNHPLIKHWTSILRNECSLFKNAMAELGRLLMYEASRDWLVQSPLAAATVEFIDPKKLIAVVPILRAGLALAEHHPSFQMLKHIISENVELMSR